MLVVAKGQLNATRAAFITHVGKFCAWVDEVYEVD
jgi:hypothetical protein